MKLNYSRRSSNMTSKLLAVFVGILLLSSGIAIALTILFDTKPADKHLIFYTNGFQADHYFVLRDNTTKVGFMNVTHDTGDFNATIVFWNIKDFTVDLLSLCADEKEDDLIFAINLPDNYCYNYLIQGGIFGAEIRSNVDINLTFVNVPEPYAVEKDDVESDQGDFTISPFDDDWTYDETNQTLFTNVDAGTTDIRFLSNRETVAIVSQGTGLMAGIAVTMMPLIVMVIMMKMLGGSMGGSKCKEDKK